MNQSNRAPLIDTLLPKARPMALEQRFMFDAAAVTAVTDPQYALEALQSDNTANDSDLARFAEPATVTSPVTVRALDVALNNGRKEVAFIDTGVTDYQTLVDGISAGVEVVLLDAGQDGLAQMALWAQSHSGYDAIHVLSHGTSGELQLGNTILNNNNINTFAINSKLSLIGKSLTSDGDLLLYGCNVASDDEGQRFIKNLCDVTGADISASIDSTGIERRGGDWELEYSFGYTHGSLSHILNFNNILALNTSQASIPLSEATSYPGSIQVGDFNGDGAVDMLIQDGTSASVTLWANNGNGVFTNAGQAVAPVTSLQINYASFRVADFDNDGDLDLYQRIPGSSNDLYLANNGSGQFTVGNLPLIDSGTTSHNSIQIGDFNNDGAVDILTQEGNTGTSVTLWLNNGSGVFSNAGEAVAATTNFTISSSALRVADIDNDEDLDLYLRVNGASNDIFFANNGVGQFVSSALPLVDTGVSTASYLQVGDFNNDGAIDILTQEGGIGAAVTLWLNDGNGYFTSNLNFVAAITGFQLNLQGLRVADFDNDGDPDIYQRGGGASDDMLIKTNDAPPTLNQVQPSSNSQGVIESSNIILSFINSNALSKGAGDIYIYIDDGDGNFSNDVIFESFSVTDSRVSLSGDATSSTVTIDPSGTFSANTTYYLVINPLSFTDADGKGFITKLGTRYHLGVPDPAIQFAGNSIDNLPDRTILSFTTGSTTVVSNAAPILTTPTAITLVDTSSTDTFSNQTGTLSATDADADAIASYGIQGGTTGGSTLVGAATYDVSKLGTYGTLYVKSSDGSYVYVPNASAINGRLANTSETFTVTATDNNASAATGTATLTVNITGVNDSPTDIGLTATSVSQSGGANATVGTLSTTDADTGDTHTYTLVSGAGDTNNGLFNISGTSLRATNAASIAPGTYTVRVQTTDAASATYAEAMTITVVDDVAPTVASVAVPSNAWYVAGQNLDFTVNFSESVTVNTTGGTPRIALTVGTTTVYATYLSGTGTSALVFRYTVQANDLDTNGIAVGTLALNGGTLADATGNNAVLTLNSVGSTSSVLVDAATPSAPTTPDLDLASDSGTSNTDNVTSDTTPTLTGTAEAGSTVTLYDTDGTVLGTTTSDGAGNWTITSSTLSSSTHTITAKVTDTAGNESIASAGLTITVDTAAPSAIALSSNTLSNSASANTAVGTLSSTDATVGDTFTYALVAGAGSTDNASFAISASSLVATNPSALSAGSKSVLVRTTDVAGNSFEQTFSITVTSNQAPAVTTPTTIALTDTSSTDTFSNQTGTLSATDADGIASFGIQGGTTGGSTVVGADTYDVSKLGTYGTLYVKSIGGAYVYVPNASAINGRLANASETFTVTATDSNASAATGTATLTVNITGVNDSPTDIGLTATSVSQSGGTNATVGTLSTTDADSGDTHTYTLVSGAGDTNNALFNISGTSLRATNAGSMTPGTYTVRVQTTDAASATYAEAMTITVVDDVAPTVASVGVPANAWYVAGQNLDFTVNFTESVTVVTTGGTPRIALTVGTTTVYATYLSGSGTSALVFRYTVQANDMDTNGIAVGTLALNGGTLADATGNNAVLTLNSVGSTSSVLVDAATPSAPTTPDLDLASDSGTSNTDNVTSDTTPTLTGTAEAGSTVTLYDTDGTVLGTTTATGGNWSITSSTLSSGSHTITAKVTDAAGNVSSTSAGLAITIDAVAPTAVALSTTSLADTLATSGSTLATLSATDTSGLTYSLVAGAGDTNNGRFTIAGTDLKAGGSNLAAGTYDIRVRATDAAGNFTDQTFTVTVTSGPSVASINRAGASALTNASTVDYTVTYNESVTGVDVSDFVLTATGTAGGTIASISGSGTTYTVTVNSLSGDGTLRLDLNNSGTGIVNAGTQAITGGFTSGQTYTLDTTPPTAPSGLDMTAGSDSGISDTDNITSDTTPTLTGGGAEAGATVKLYDTDGTTLLGTTTADGSGNWSITTSALTDGAHTLKAKVTDAAGNTGAASTALTVTIDTTAPSAPGAPDLASASDSGSSSTDNNTSVTTPTLTGSGVDAGATVTLYDTNGTTVLGTATADGSGNWSITSSTLASGAHTLTTKVTDAAGNTSAASAGLTVTIDTTAPSAPSAPDLASGSDAGTSNTDNITSVTTPTLTGSGAEAGATVTLYDTNGTTVLGTATADGSGNWSITSSTLTNGAHTLTTKVTDPAGNTSAASAGLTVTIDATTPSAPGAPDLAGGSDTGTSNTDNITSVASPTVTGGGAEAGATVTLYDTNGTTVLGTATADGSGNWSITANTLSDGVHTFTTKVTDAAGNTSAGSAGLTVTIDTTEPSASGAADLANGSDTGTSNIDNLTNATTPTVTGSGAEAGATIRLYDTDGTTLLGTTTADGSGNWSITSSTLTTGAHTLTTKVTDAAGNTSSASMGLTVTVDTTSPTAPGAPDLASASDSGSSSTDNITSVTTPTLTGSGVEAGATVTLYDTDGTTVLGTATADASGNWSITSSTLTSGAHTLTTKVTDAAGNTGAASAGLTMTIDTTAPSAPSAPDLASGSDAGTSNTDNITSVTTPTLTGSGAEAGATVTLYDTNGTTVLGTATADGSGNWSITSSTLSTGSHTLTTKVTDAAGNTGAASAGLTLTVDTTAPTAIVLSADSVMDVATGTNTAVAILSSADTQSVSYTLESGNGTNDAGNASFVIAGGVLQSQSQLTAGTYNIRIGATDAAGNISYQTFTITVNAGGLPSVPVVSPQPAAPVITLVRAAPVEIVRPPVSSFFSSSALNNVPMLSSDPLISAVVMPLVPDMPVQGAAASVVAVGVAPMAGTNFSGLRAMEASRDVVIERGEQASFTLPAGTFVHTDGNARVALSARLADGRPLPSFVKFNPTTGTFTVEAGSGDQAEQLQVVVNAVDDKGQTASTTVVIKLKEKARTSSVLDLQIKLGKPALAEQFRQADKPAGAMAELAALSKAFAASHLERSRA
jgi:hypothetical protein